MARPSSGPISVPCPCGKTHTFSERALGLAVQALVERLGEETSIFCGGRHYRVSRYYLSFHRVHGYALPALAQAGHVAEVEMPDDMKPPADLKII